MDRSYVGRVVKLAHLSPSIIEAIVDGQEPSSHSLEQMAKADTVVWE